MTRLISRLLCRLGRHGPALGVGPDNNSARNYRCGYLHRRCDVCGDEWVAEMVDRGDRWGLRWHRLRSVGGRT